MDIEIKQYTINYSDIIYLAARGCYGLEDITHELFRDKIYFIQKLISKGHDSVLEHGIISIHIIGCSRSFMAQITRHRLVSFSIKSQHYVNHQDFKVKPLENVNSEVQEKYNNVMQIIKDNYKIFVNRYKVPIHIAREILPNSCLTNIFMTANFREWRYIIKLRQTELNTLEMMKFAKIIKTKFRTLIPGIFDDL